MYKQALMIDLLLFLCQTNFAYLYGAGLVSGVYPPLTRLEKRLIQKGKYMLDKDSKDKIIKKYKTHEQDTGSAEVQIAILTEEIKRLTEHLKSHKKDFSSRRGLIKKVGQRRRLLKFLKRDNQQSYEDLAKKLKLKVKITDATTSIPEEVEEAMLEEVQE